MFRAYPARGCWSRNDLLELLHAVADDAKQAATVEEAVAARLERVCTYTGWPVGHACFVDATGGLVSSCIWHLDGAERYAAFREEIDDEADSRILLAHHTEEMGCRTVTAASGEEGLRLARELRPDLITLDLLMPGMNGWNRLRELQADAELRHIPVVVVSVLAEESRRDLEGAAELVDKPVGRGPLLAALRRALARGVQRALVVDGDPVARTAAADLPARGRRGGADGGPPAPPCGCWTPSPRTSSSWTPRQPCRTAAG